MQTANLQVVQVTSAHQYGRLRTHSNLPPFDARLVMSHRADAHWVVMHEDRLTARCSLWWKQTATIPRGRLGVIGHYAAVDDTSAAGLLELVSDQLASHGCTQAVGPMDQNTWRDYRLATTDACQPRFFLEPAGAPEWPGQFTRGGFREIAWYFSALAADLTIQCPRLEAVRNRMALQGVRIRKLREDQIESDLKQIYAVARIAFQEHLFYEDVGEAEFLEQYRPLQQMIPTELVLVAEQSDRVIGFCFAMPDLLQAERGQPIDTVIIKTFAVLPDLAYAGLGRVLLEETQQHAAKLGFRRGIHALVREVHHMQKISRRYAVPFRRYALFGKELSR